MQRSEKAMSEPVLILTARRGLPRYYFLLLVCLVAWCILGLAGWDLVLGRNPNIPDRGLSLIQRTGIAALIIAIAAALLGALLMFGARYIVTLHQCGYELEIATLRPLGLHRARIPLANVRLGEHYAPVVSGRQHVDAPGQPLRLAGFTLPFLIDLQASHYDEQHLRRAIAAARRTQDWAG